MKQSLFGAIVMALMSFWFIGTPQSVSAGSLQSFVIDEYYLGAGGKPPELATFANDPRAFLRSEDAYIALKKGFADKLGHSALSDVEFEQILAGDQVRLVNCTGRINTAGINRKGNVGWSTRSCYAGEKLIELRVGNNWQLVASQGCFNLVRPISPVPTFIPKPKPKPQPKPPSLEVTSGPLLHSPKVFIQQTPGLTVHSCACPGNHSCHSDIYLPGTRSFLFK